MNFEELLQKELDKLPYQKHVDDGGYNDGQLIGFEAGARWAYEFVKYWKARCELAEKYIEEIRCDHDISTEGV